MYATTSAVLRLFAACALACLAPWTVAGDAPAAGASAQAPAATNLPPNIARFLQSLHVRTGSVPITAALANVNLQPSYGFLEAADAQRVLSDFWSNPPDKNVLGLIIPGTDPKILLDPSAWAVVLTYVGDGHVSDQDAAGLDYAKLLAQMQQHVREANPGRVKAGYPAMELVGWAEPPHYDPGTHKLYWARDLRFTSKITHADADALNYDIRVLGRQGYLSLNAVAPIDQLAKVRQDMPAVLAMTEFDPGQRYADYDAKTDRLAAYGIGALVAGGIAAKAGLFAKLGVLLLALKKFIVLGIAAIGGLLARLFRRRTR